MGTSWHRLGCVFSVEQFQFMHLTDGHRGSESLAGVGMAGAATEKDGRT